MKNEEFKTKAIWKLCGVIAALFLLLLCCLSVDAQAAEQTEADTLQADTGQADTSATPSMKELYMIGDYSGGTVRLRWAASSYPLWLAMQKKGVVLERYEFEPERPVPPVRTLLPVIPFLEKDTTLISSLAQTDNYAALLGEAVYSPQLQLGFSNPASGPDWASLRVKQEQEALRFVLANLAYDRSFAVACLGSMGYADRHVNEGKYYLYRLFMEGGKDTAIFFTRQEKVAVAGSLPIQELEVEIKNGKAHISWPHAFQGTPSVGYFIERAEEKSRIFKRLNNDIYADFVQDENRYVSYTDSLPDADKKYRYRVLVRDLFGGERVIAMSRAEGNRNYLSALPRIDSLKTAKKGFELFWSFPEEEKSLVHTFSLYAVKRPVDVLTGEPLAASLPAGTRSWLIPAAKMPPSAYFYLVAEGFEGEQKVSLPWFRQEDDSIAPAAPKGLKATVDSMAVLTLRWDPSPEADFKGYRVFFALNPQSEPVQLTSAAITDTFFVDTLTLMSPQKFCYGVKAEDKRGNLSEMSEYIQVGNGRPDRPFPAVFLFDCPESAKGVELRWENSPSSNLRGQVLQYRVDGGGWMVLKEYVKGPRTDSLPASYFFEYPATLYNRRYEFRLLAYGEDPMRDTAYSPFNHSVMHFAHPSAPKLRLTPDRERKFIHVQWSRIDRGDVKHIYLYRKKENEKMLLLACLQGDETKNGFYVDGRVSINTEYAYKIQVEFSDGTWSERGPEVSVEY